MNIGHDSNKKQKINTLSAKITHLVTDEVSIQNVENFHKLDGHAIFDGMITGANPWTSAPN